MPARPVWSHLRPTSLIRPDFVGPLSPACGKRRGRILAVGATACLQACSASPSQDILGSFFPSWLLCAGLGVLGAALARWLLAVLGVDRFVPLALVTYAALAFSLTCLVWLLRFGN